MGLNFLYAVRTTSVLDDHKVTLVVARGTEIESEAHDLSMDVIVAPRSPLQRILFEIGILSWVILSRRVDVVYSYFGNTMALGKYVHVSGSADANLYYPEFDFWKGYSGPARFKRSVVDAYRRFGLRRSDGIIFENPALESRFHGLFNGRALTDTIGPSIAVPDEREPWIPPPSLGARPFALFLCGWHRNKQLQLLPEIAAVAKERGLDLHLLLTANMDGSRLQRQVYERARKLDVADSIICCGTVAKNQLESVYRRAFAVMLLSGLESFSNNIIEAWAFERPLVVTDADWSRQLCGNAAVYVDRYSPSSIVSALMSLYDEEGLRQTVIEEGRKMLNGQNSPERRLCREVDFLERAYARAH